MSRPKPKPTHKLPLNLSHIRDTVTQGMLFSKETEEYPAQNQTLATIQIPNKSDIRETVNLWKGLNIGISVCVIVILHFSFCTNLQFCISICICVIIGRPGLLHLGICVPRQSDC